LARIISYCQQLTDAAGRIQERNVPNPFLGEMDSATRLHVIRSAELIERRRGDMLCRVGDEGDTMFVVLDGTVGVFPPNGANEELSLEPRIVVGPGEIVGELAFSLQRPRTASLMAIDDAAMLSVQAATLQAQARSNSVIAANLEKFVTARMLQYVCDSCDFLIGRDGKGPLADAGRKRAWERLLPHTEMIVCPLSDLRTVTLHDPRFAGDGIYILVNSRLRSLPHSDKLLDGAQLPLVYVDLPGRVVCPDHPYRPEGRDAVILHVGQKAFLGPRATIENVAARLKHELARLFYFDVFLSYTFDDNELAQRWRNTFEKAGLRVYMEVSRTGHYFRERIEAGILDSLTFVALVSANTMARPLDQNWVRQEIDFRKAVFENSTANIFPVRLKGGKPEVLADGYTVTDAIGREEAAIEELIEGIRLTKQVRTLPPQSLTRKLDLRL